MDFRVVMAMFFEITLFLTHPVGFEGWQKPQKSDHWIIYVEMFLNVDKKLNVKNQFNLYSTANNFVDKIWTAVDNL